MYVTLIYRTKYRRPTSFNTAKHIALRFQGFLMVILTMLVENLISDRISLSVLSFTLFKQ